MTGTYTCEVSTETVFETVSAQAEMTVVGKPLFIKWSKGAVSAT